VSADMDKKPASQLRRRCDVTQTTQFSDLQHEVKCWTLHLEKY